jgi:hypothetical protein
VRAIPYRTPLYAYDLDVFISSIAQDLQMARSMLSLFEGASGLGCNMNKCQMAPIRCDAEQIALATNVFPCSVVRVGDMLPTWKDQLMHRSGRLILIRTTLSAMPIYTYISVDLPPWVHKSL